MYELVNPGRRRKVVFNRSHYRGRSRSTGIRRRAMGGNYTTFAEASSTEAIRRGAFPPSSEWHAHRERKVQSLDQSVCHCRDIKKKITLCLIGLPKPRKPTVQIPDLFLCWCPVQPAPGYSQKGKSLTKEMNRTPDIYTAEDLEHRVPKRTTRHHGNGRTDRQTKTIINGDSSLLSKQTCL